MSTTSLNEMKLNLTGVDLTVRKTEVAATSILRKLTGVYDEHAKLVFMFDVSGSMNGRVAKTYTDQYVWTPEILAAIRQKVTDAISKANIAMTNPLAMLMGGGLGGEEVELLKMTDATRGPNGELTFTPADDEELEQRVVRHSLIGTFGVEVNWEKHSEQPMTRIDLVKKLAASELRARFAKYPASRVAVIPFGDRVNVMFDDGNPEVLWASLEKLCMGYEECGGGTDIMRAIAKAIDVCRVKPSPVGLHHFIVVSDGEDSVADQTIGAWVAVMKASGIILDYIHIGDTTANEGLMRACKELGGEMVTVNTQKDFESRFVAAVNRPMLPAGN